MYYYEWLAMENKVMYQAIWAEKYKSQLAPNDNVCFDIWQYAD